MQYRCVQPPFDPSKPVDWADVRGLCVHVSQDGYAYKSGPWPSVKEAEAEAEDLRMIGI